MLTIHDKIPSDMEYIHDVEEAFNFLELKDTPKIREILRHIENAEYIDARYVVDRFGAKLRVDDISTGCKAAILVASKPNTCVNTIECGVNARDAIINLVEDGNILMEWNELDISEISDKINCRVDNYVFNTVSRLNYYFSDEKPFKADLNIGGVVEYV